MNVVIFGKGFGKPRQLNLSGLRATGFVVACVAGLGACGFAAGHWFSSLTGSGISVTEVAQLTDELQQQRDNIETIRSTLSQSVSRRSMPGSSGWMRWGGGSRIWRISMTASLTSIQRLPSVVRKSR